MLISTATLPGILQHAAHPLGTTGVRTFETLARTRIRYCDTQLSSLDLVNDLDDSGFFDPEESALIVLNTTNSSREAYEAAVGAGLNEDFELFHLSSQIIPKDRLARIDEISDLLKEEQQKQPILITTQLIEAGVDVSFHKGFRDLAPLESIIQTAGRVNRSGKDARTKEIRHHATIDVRPLIHPTQGCELCKYVYDPKLIDITKTLLRSNPNMDENQFRQKVMAYFKDVRKASSEEEGRQILASACSANFTRFDDFQLIPQDYYRLPVFVEVDNEATQAWESYKELSTIKDWKKRQDKYISLKRSLYSHVINVPHKSIAQIMADCEEFNGLIRVKREFARKYYDKNMGFVGAGGVRLGDLVI